MLLRDRQANTPWQKLRRNLLLFLQLMILAALVLAISRPALPLASISSGSLVVLMDASASMNVVEDTMTRFELAKVAIRALIRDLDGAEGMTLVLVGKQPVILAAGETDKDRLYKILDQAAATQGAVDWQAAFAIAAGATSQAGVNSTTLIVSDGGMPDTGLPALSGDVRYLPIGKASENIAFTAMSLRAAGTKAELFISIKNFGQTDQEILLSIYQNNNLLETQTIRILAGEERSVTVSSLPDVQGVYFARLTPAITSESSNAVEQSLDVLDLDNSAFATYQPERSGRVLLVSEENIFLEQVLAAVPSITPFRYKLQENTALQLPQESFDCYIFAGILPDDLPAGNFLLINPPTNEFFRVTGSFDPSQTARVLTHPLTEYLDWSNIHIAKASQLEIPAWGETLVEVDDQPIVFVGEIGGRRLAVLMFDLHDSDLPLQVAFPILFANLLNYLVPSHSFEAQDGLLPGDSLEIRTQPDVENVVIASPSGRVFSYLPTGNDLLFTDTNELGLYSANFIQGDTRRVEYFAVNLFDPEESDIQPQEAINIGRSTLQASDKDRLSLREIWHWAALVALAILLIEWWVYHRSTRLGGLL
jgi:hypothetical protein